MPSDNLMRYAAYMYAFLPLALTGICIWCSLQAYWHYNIALPKDQLGRVLVDQAFKNYLWGAIVTFPIACVGFVLSYYLIKSMKVTYKRPKMDAATSADPSTHLYEEIDPLDFYQAGPPPSLQEIDAVFGVAKRGDSNADWFRVTS